MVEDIEHFHAELNVEVFRDARDAIIFEDRKVQRHDPWTDQCIAPLRAPKIEAGQWRQLRLGRVSWIYG